MPTRDGGDGPTLVAVCVGTSMKCLSDEGAALLSVAGGGPRGEYPRYLVQSWREVTGLALQRKHQSKHNRPSACIVMTGERVNLPTPMRIIIHQVKGHLDYMVE